MVLNTSQAFPSNVDDTKNALKVVEKNQIEKQINQENSSYLRMFATDHEVAQLEIVLLSIAGAGRLWAMLTLAWQLRQRDTKRALSLADEIRANLANSNFSEDEHCRVLARLLLIQGEAKWLSSEFDASKTIITIALHDFAALGDAIGCADAHWLLAWIAQDQGHGTCMDVELDAMIAFANDCDRERVIVAQAMLARSAAFRDLAATRQRWDAHFALLAPDLHPATAYWIEDYFGITAALDCNFVGAIEHCSKAYVLAIITGQVRRALNATVCISSMFNDLSEYQTALEWMQRGRDLALTSGWSISIASNLFQTAETLRRMQRYDVAYDLLQEALNLMTLTATSRTYTIALLYLGDVELNRKRFVCAFNTFQLLEQRAIALAQFDLLSAAQCGQAKALFQLGQPQQALQAANAVLKVVTSSIGYRISALRVIADIYTHIPGICSQDFIVAKTPLYYLDQALFLADSIEGYIVPCDLLDAIAQEHANSGEYVKAFQFSKRAGQVREKIHNQEAINRANALQVSYQTEQARVEAEHHRQQAKFEAERANTLQLANATLEQLGTIGREITGNLDASTVFAALNIHLHSLLHATTFMIYRLERGGQILNMVYGVEAGQISASHLIRVDDLQRNAARCAREREEIISGVVPGDCAPIAGTLVTLSQMYAPLLVGERLLGVLTIQSENYQAYGERERAILRTLCAYSAIALANAETQSKLVEKNLLLEQLSVTDTLTGINNRLKLDQVLDEELNRRGRSPKGFALILLDVDHFKSVNDSFGHPVGDLVLVEMARLLVLGTRNVDVVGRWGGEEFLIICRDTDLDGAVVLAEKLRELISAHSFPYVGRKTASFGVTSFTEGDNAHRMLARTDGALYRSKSRGRNCIEIAI